MSYKNDSYMKLVKDIEKSNSSKAEVTDKQAEEAFKTILSWIGEDPSREGLLETPKRVVKAFRSILRDINKMPMQIYQKPLGM
jgi:GTP cyclohydrolase IA